MKVGKLLLLALGSVLVFGCSPHPSAGTWKAISDNELGIVDLSVKFDGKAEFVTTKKDIAVWHCFWGKEDKTAATMQCVPSSDTERRELYQFVVRGEERGELFYDGNLIAVFGRQSYQ